jgi:hypothetical protein
MTLGNRHLWCVITAAVAGAPTFGETLSYQQAVALQPTGWSVDASVPQFDPDMGQLLGIELVLSGDIEGTAAYESLNARPADIVLDFAADLVFDGPTLNGGLSIHPSVTIEETAGAFDGLVDLGGTSGATHPDLFAADVLRVGMNTGFGVFSYIGQGVVPFTITSFGASRGAGAGNLLLNFQQSSAASVEVVYTYSVPEPSTAALIVLGVVLLWHRRRTRPVPVPLRLRPNTVRGRSV